MDPRLREDDREDGSRIAEAASRMTEGMTPACHNKNVVEINSG
jgi:hypothetical protein